MYPLQKLPLGIQSFEKLITDGFMYIDKTALIYQIVQRGQIYFLSRPRRFGKSLLISTFKAYFEGKKHLFDGLAMENLEKEWEEYPVIHIDFSRAKYYNISSLHETLSLLLARYENLYGKNPDETQPASRLAGIIERAYRKTGKQVVVLVDEYDAPMLDNMLSDEVKAEMRTILRSFYSPLKPLGEYLRFVFLTGISKFSQMSIFSELNNITNISMLPQYSTLCGITENEMLTNFPEHIAALAENNEETYDEACTHLKMQYDGYHFSEKSEDIYNPYSLINVLEYGRYSNYWFSTGTPSFLLELVQRFNVNIKDLEGVTARSVDFDKPTDVITDFIPIFYQSGYLTIKGYNRILDQYTLGYPNKEVKEGFAECLLPLFIPDYNPTHTEFALTNYIEDLYNGEVETFLRRMKAFFSSISYKMQNKTERDFQNIFYLMSIYMGAVVRVEEASAIGRSDLVIELPTHVYIFEFKYDFPIIQETIRQIERKNYAEKYAMCGKKIVKVGVNFSAETRTLGDWVIKG